MIIWTNRVSKQFLNVKNKKIASYWEVTSSSWVNGSLALTHDPLTHFHLWGDRPSPSPSGSTPLCGPVPGFKNVPMQVYTVA